MGINNNDNQDEFSQDSAKAHDYSRDPLSLDDKNSKDFLQEFVVEHQKRLSSFLRKKITIRLNGVTSFYPDKYQHDFDKEIVLSFQVTPGAQHGILFFDFLFLHTVITLLYGGVVDPNEPVMNRMGKFGIRIATKLAEICLGALQHSIQEHLKIDSTLTNLSPHLYSFCKQDKLLQFLNFSLTINYESINSTLNIVVPGNLFDTKLDEATHSPSVNHDLMTSELDLQKLFDSRLHDSVVDLCVALPDIKLRVQDALDLKSGDLIPMGDPESVLVYLGNKKLFKGLVGQANTKRVVKITTKL